VKLQENQVHIYIFLHTHFMLASTWFLKYITGVSI